MWTEIILTENLTLDKLRELVKDGELSKFPDSMPINMCIELCGENVIDKEEQPCAPVLSIIGDDKEINFYNYI